jgi:nucleoside-diphosphate-sugar epimerase
MKSLALLSENQIIDHGVRDSFEASCADTRRLEQITGWKPSTKITEGIQAILRYEKGKKQGGAS